MLKKRRVELKYSLFFLGLVGLFYLLQQVQILAEINLAITALLNLTTKMGLLGIFLLAVVGNASMLIQIPYTLPLLSLALKEPDLPEMIGAGMIAGLGASIGKCGAYHLAKVFFSANSHHPWIAQKLTQNTKLTPFIIFAVIASPLPDETVILPLAGMRYGLKRLLPPVLLGKILHTTVVAFVFYAFSDMTGRFFSGGAKADGAFLILALLMLSIFYQFEKARPPHPTQNISPTAA